MALPRPQFPRKPVARKKCSAGTRTALPACLTGRAGQRTVEQLFAEIDQLSETADERAETILGALYDWAETIAPER